MRVGRVGGRRLGGDPNDEREPFLRLPRVAQSVDKRDLGQAFHHEEPEHKPLLTELTKPVDAYSPFVRYAVGHVCDAVSGP